MLCPTKLSSMQRKTAKETWRPKCAVPRLGYEQNKKAACCCSYVGHQNEVIFVGESLNVVQKVSLSFYLAIRIRGPISNWEGGREGGRERKGGTKRGGASCRQVPAEDQVISCWYMAYARYQVEEGR